MEYPGIHALISLIQGHLLFLGHRPSPQDLERWALRIYRAMAGQRRMFHRQSHALTMAEGGDSIAALAALFHDSVYVQVDQGLPEQYKAELELYVTVKDGAYAVAADPPSAYPVGLVTELFGFKHGEVLSPYAGLNEFLSALVAVTELDCTLTPAQLAQLVCCIEGTIPFRKADGSGAKPFERLAARLRELNRRAGLGMSEAEVVSAIRRAVWLARRDVENFAHDDPGRFLDNTWLLLPEGNSALLDPDTYTIKEYRGAMQKMEGFLGGLSGDRVFHRFEDEPSEVEHARLVAAADRNISIAARYLRAKVLASAILEALADLTGGDVPISLFMGQIASRNPATPKLERWLPSVPAHAGCDPLILRLLETGRATDTSFDSKEAPLATFVYRWLGDEGAAAAMGPAKRMFQGELPPGGFLAGLEPRLVDAVARAAEKLVVSRGALLRARPWAAPAAS